MLSELPSEIIYHIATYLPTASALAHLAQTCRRLYRIITVEDSRIFRAFVKSNFPSIQTPPLWRDAAQALTSRSRALDRHAIIGRFVLPPEDAIKIGSHQATRRDNPTLGYRPAIASYEVWTGERWADRREVLAWGAADEIAIRIKHSGIHKQEKWFRFNDLDHISSYDDICGIHLLKPEHYTKEADKEHLIFGRVRGDLVHLVISPDEATHEYRQKFATYGLELDRMDLSNGPEPLMAAHFDNGSIAFYHTTTGEAEVQPFTYLRIDSEGVARHKYSKFLSHRQIAVGTGGLRNSLSVSAILPDRVSMLRAIGVDSLDLDENSGTTWKANVSAIAPLTSQPAGGDDPGNVFLAAWGDRAVRLHDLRSENSYETIYRDTTDNNPVYSIHPFGNDRFLVGAGGDAVVKIFDLRMPNTYSYLDAKLPAPPQNPKGSPNKTKSHSNGIEAKLSSMSIHDCIVRPRKDFSIFLSHRPPTTSLPGRANRRRNNHSYRGPIYTMSSPSPSSPTIYTGIVDGVFRLDFASTDDLTGPCGNWYRENLALDLDMSKSAPLGNKVLELSGYERPDPEDLSSTSKLKNQWPFWRLEDADAIHEQETGWDRRWEPPQADGAWRRSG